MMLKSPNSLPVPPGCLPVQRYSCEGEAAGIHGQVDEEMHCFAHVGPKEPVVQGVDGGLEWHTENNEAQVSYSQIQDEEVSSIVDLSVPQQHCQDQGIAHHAYQEYQGIH